MKNNRIFTIVTLVLGILTGICFAFIPQSYIQVGVQALAASGYATIQNNGTPVTQRTILNFLSGTTCVDNAGTSSTDCTSSGGGSFTATPPYISDGTNFYGNIFQFVKPIDGNYAWVNQGTATKTTANGSVTLFDGSYESNFNIHARVKTLPAAPYCIEACFTYYQGSNTNQLLGIGWRDSATGHLLIYGIYQNTAYQIVAFYATDPNTYGGSTPVNNAGFTFSGGLMCLRIGDNGAGGTPANSRTYWIGTDNATWLQMQIESNTNLLTPNQSLFFLNGGKSSLRLLHWKEVSSACT